MKKTKQLVPKRRFKEFENSGEWKQHKLKDVVRFTKGRGYAKRDLTASGTPIILYGRLYTNFETVINKVDTFAKAKENTVYSTGTEVIVPSSGETAEDIARAAAVRKEGVILGGDLNIMHLVESKDPVFLALSISNGNRKKELIKRAQGSSVVHLYNTDLEEAEVLFPKIEEQRKISSFFKHIDNLINLQKNKIEKSKKIKKSYLSDMFPKEGVKYPKKRFEGFTEPWKKQRLNEITNYITSSLSAGKSLDEGKYKLYDANGVIGYSNTGQQEEYISIIKDGSGVGRVRLLPKKSNFIGTMGGILRKEKNDIYYLYAFLQKFDFTDYIIGATIPHVYFRDYGESVNYHPGSEEQIKIGNFFKNLDNQIDLEEQKLNKLEQLKQAYLNELFV